MKQTISFCTFFTIFIIFCSSLFVNSQTDSCSSNLNLGVRFPFDTTSLNCLSVWDAKGFILRYTKTTNNIWSFVLSATDPNSYVGIGFSSNGRMVGSSAIVGWVADTGGVIKRYYLGGTSPSLVQPDKGNLQVVSNSTLVMSQSSRLYLVFQLETIQPESRILYSIGPSGRFPLASNYLLFEHNDMVSTHINYMSGQSTFDNPHSRLRKSHGILNILGWGILMIIGAIVGRYLKQYDPLWFYLHIGIQTFGFILGVAGVICGLVLNDRIDAHVTTHKALGIFILVLGCLQLMALLARPDKASKMRKYWNWYHHNSGRILLILATANIFYGIKLGEAGKGWNIGYALVFCILLITTLLLEFKMWFRK